MRRRNHTKRRNRTAYDLMQDGFGDSWEHKAEALRARRWRYLRNNPELSDDDFAL